MTGLATGDQVRFSLRLHSMTEYVNGYMKVIYTGVNIATSASTVASAQIFKIPTLNNKGGVYFDYFVDVLDKNGQNIGGKSAQGDAFTLDTYTPPTMTSLSAERYTTRPTDTGTGTITTADNSGEYVRFSFKLNPAVTTVTGNTYTLSVKATSGGGSTKTNNSAYTGTAALTKTNDTTIFPAASNTFSAAEDWTFTFTVKDKVTSVSYTCQVARADSILNVESGGVAIGGFLSTTGAFTNNNILRGTGSPSQLLTDNAGIESSSWANGTWSSASSGNGKLALISTTDNPDGVLSGFRISGNTSGKRDVGQADVPLTKGQVYTASCWARVQSGSAKLQVRIFSRAPSSALAATAINGVTVNSTTWKHMSGTFTISSSNTGTSFTALFGIMGSGSTLDICGFKLEKGNIINPTWAPAPQDNAEVTTFDKPKRFEVAGDCGTILRGGLWDPLGYRMDYVNNTMLLPYDSTTFEPYSRHDAQYDVNTADTMPMLSRVGPIVFMEGVLKNIKEITLDLDGIKLCTLPSWARPRMRVSQVCQGTTTNVFWTHVEATGDVILSRYRNGSSYNKAAVGCQFQFTMCWLAADAAPPLPEIS